MVEERRGRVLVVDDDDVQRTYLRACLEGEFDVIEAEDGAAALALLTGGQAVDLVLLDVEMPGMDGYSVLGRIRKADKLSSLPVLILTSREDEVNEEIGLDLGASDFQVKPPRPGALVSRIRNLITAHWERSALADRANEDPLCGLPNKRRFHAVLEKEWRRATRSGTVLSLMLIDVDHFKAFNDRHGHVRGDEVLTAVGGVLRGVIGRPGDLAARFGGEEFALLLPGTDDLGGRKVAQALRAALAELAIPHGATEVDDMVTVSIGGATTLPHGEGDDASFLRHVDRLLYRAKDLGRNQLVWESWSTETLAD